jgi:hypothetical protein
LWKINGQSLGPRRLHVQGRVAGVLMQKVHNVDSAGKQRAAIGGRATVLAARNGANTDSRSRQAVSDVELKGGQPRVDATAIHEFGVGALLHQPAMVQHQNAICFLHRGQPVGYHQCGAALHG